MNIFVAPLILVVIYALHLFNSRGYFGPKLEFEETRTYNENKLYINVKVYFWYQGNIAWSDSKNFLDTITEAAAFKDAARVKFESFKRAVRNK